MSSAEMISNNAWYVLQLRPNGLRRAETHLMHQGVRTFAPLMRGVGKSKKNGQEASPKPLFPGYLFVSFSESRPLWGAIRSTRGVARVVSSPPPSRALCRKS
jgi:transcriptional antiterminator RfaH